jgi:hypothetical protein
MPLSTLFTVGARSDVDTRLVSRTAARHVDRVLLGRISELSAAQSKSAPSSLAAENQALRAELAAIKASTSWRITNPVRRLGRFLRRS